MKYLARFLTPENFSVVRGEKPTKPTKPPIGGSRTGGQPPISDGYEGGETYKTYETPSSPGADFDAQLAAYELRAVAIREQRGVPQAESERLAYRELIDRLDGAEPPPPRVLTGLTEPHPDAYALAEREAIRAEAEPDPPAVLVATVEARDVSRVGEEHLARALRFLAGMLQLDRELKRPYLLEWAIKNGISESDLLDAAERLGVMKTLHDDGESWTLRNPI